MKVIAISGKARHGKDSCAGFMKDFLEFNGNKVLIAHYGDLVKYVCKTFFDWNGEKDEVGRTLLQQVGTEAIRSKEPSYWVRFICDILRFFPDEWDYVLIPDCRFPNEIEYLKECGFDVTHVRVVRENFESPLTEEQQNHPSETALDGYNPDILLLNSDSLEDLKEVVRVLTNDLVSGIMATPFIRYNESDCEILEEW